MIKELELIKQFRNLNLEVGKHVDHISHYQLVITKDFFENN